MRTVRDVMHGDMQVLRTTETAADAAAVLATHGEETVPLCQSDGSLAGAVSNRALVAKVVAPGRDPRTVSLAEFAVDGDAVALDVDISLEEAVALMCRHERAQLPVVEGERVVGWVTRREAACSVSFKPPWADDSVG
ncbi:MAG TPA: CBS domain-containing protein [Acidimicrobiales bacterium]